MPTACSSSEFCNYTDSLIVLTLRSTFVESAVRNCPPSTLNLQLSKPQYQYWQFHANIFSKLHEHDSIQTSGITSWGGGGAGGSSPLSQRTLPSLPSQMSWEFLLCLWGRVQLCPLKNLPCHPTCPLLSESLVTLLIQTILWPFCVVRHFRNYTQITLLHLNHTPLT